MLNMTNSQHIDWIVVEGRDVFVKRQTTVYIVKAESLYLIGDRQAEVIRQQTDVIAEAARS